jgi:hypothetical protein
MIDEIIGGPIVNQFFETSHPGVFACGNCLQVYDTVDVLALDAKEAGKNAANNMINKGNKSIQVKPGEGIRYVIPQLITNTGTVYFTLRVKKPGETGLLRVIASGKELYKKKLPWINPANMIRFDFNITEEIFQYESLEVSLYE